MKIQNPRPEVGMTAPIPGHWAQIHAQYKNKAILLNAPNRSRQSSFRNCGNSSMPKCGLKARWRAGKNTSKPRPAAICQAFPGLCRTLRSAKAGVWNRGYEIGLGRYLAERTWLCASQNPRLTPNSLLQKRSFRKTCRTEGLWQLR